MNYNSNENLDDFSFLQSLNDADLYQIFGATESVGYVQKVRGSGNEIGTIKSIRDLATGITTYNNDILFDNLNYDGEPETHAPTYKEFNDARLGNYGTFYFSTYQHVDGIVVGCPVNFNIYGTYTDKKCVKMGDIEIQSLDYLAAFNVFSRCTTSTYAGTINTIDIMFYSDSSFSTVTAVISVRCGLTATTANAQKSFSNISSYGDTDYVILNYIEDDNNGYEIVKLGTPLYMEVRLGVTGGGGGSNLRRCYVGNSLNTKEYTLSRTSVSTYNVIFRSTSAQVIFKGWHNNTISFEWGAS